MIGASDNPDSFGGRFWRHSAMSRDIRRYAVNRRAGAVRDAPCVSALSELPEVPELVVIATPPSTVEGLIEECLTIGAAAAIVLASIDRASRGVVRDRCTGRLTLLGGSSLGLIDPNGGVVLSSSISLALPLRGGPLGLVSQSGALMGVLHARALGQGFGLGTCISTGEQVDVRAEDVLLALAQDDHLETVGVYLEDIDPGAFATAVRALQASGRKLVALKGGTSRHGAAATAAHSGALASDGRAFKALARDLGAVVADDPDELLNCMQATLFHGRRFFVGTLSGGLAAVAADLAVASGVDLADCAMSPAEVEVGPIGAGIEVNPVDIDAITGNEVQAIDLIARLATDPRGDGVVLVVSDSPRLEALLGRIGAIGNEALSRLQVCSECSGQYEPVLSDHLGGALSFIRGLRQCFDAIARTREGDGARSVGRSTPRPASDDNQQRPTVLLDGPTTWDLLSRAGVPTVPLHRVRSEGDLEAILSKGLPIVLKADGVAHRGDNGVVVVQDRASAIAAFRTLAPRQKVIAQPQTTSGLEFFVGVTRDPVFGPLFLVGAGGPELEEIGDIVVHLGLPKRDEIRALLGETSAGQWLCSTIGHQLIDLDALCALAEDLCEWFGSVPEIASLDANPIVAHPSGAAVLDAKVRLFEATIGSN